jgi:hypothetical protein
MTFYEVEGGGIHTFSTTDEHEAFVVGSEVRVPVRARVYADGRGIPRFSLEWDRPSSNF